MKSTCQLKAETQSLSDTTCALRKRGGCVRAAYLRDLSIRARRACSVARKQCNIVRWWWRHARSPCLSQNAKPIRANLCDLLLLMMRLQVNRVEYSVRENKRTATDLIGPS